jgi:hypothetical protein
VHPQDEYVISARDRVYDQATGSREGRRSIMLVLLAASLFVLVLSVSCRQATAPGPANRVLASGVSELTDIDQYLADQGPAIRQSALDSSEQQLQLPGYPLDVVLTRDQVVKSSDAQLRDLILSRSAALVYAGGLGEFDRTGSQSIRRFSLQGALELGVDQISESTHSRASFLALLALLSSAVCGAVVAATAEGWSRLRLLGFAAVAGGLPCVLLAFLLRLITGAVGGNDPFEVAMRSIVRSVLAVPLRNGLILLAAGAVLIVIAVVLNRVERMTLSPAADAGEDW